MFPDSQDLVVPCLGRCDVPNPLLSRREYFADEESLVLLPSTMRELNPYLEAGELPPVFEQAGPRRSIFFEPKGLRCGVVTCGGICPGINDVIRSIVLSLTYNYGVSEIDGFRYGYAGLSKAGLEPAALTPKFVETIHEHGGTVLGSSRGPQDVGEMVDTLVSRNISVLFVIGGDGTLRGAQALYEEVTRRQLDIGIVGIPKTIDNDLLWVERSFGFATAVEQATIAINAAHTEATGAYNGVGIVKLMGRHSGFITAHAVLAHSDVNFCLVPEVNFNLTGQDGLFEALEARLNARNHAVVAVAEGAAQELVAAQDMGTDLSGNTKLKDVGVFLRDRIDAHLSERGLSPTIKYIDPSYIIRSLEANTSDSEYCLTLGQHAAHAGMSGRTNVMIGYWNQRFTHVPLPVVVEHRKKIDPSSKLWQRVLDATGQPNWR